MSKAGNFISGGQGDFNYANLPDIGVVGHALNDGADGINEAICATLGPDFLKVRLQQSHTCPNGVFPPTIFNSWTNFCKYYNNATPNIKECLSPSAIYLSGNLKGIANIYGRLGKCCRSCQVSIKEKHIGKTRGQCSISLFFLHISNLVLKS